jgi:hypothetical protein
MMNCRAKLTAAEQNTGQDFFKMTVDFDNPPAKVISPSKLAHVVFRTSNFSEKVDF